ncbi:MAG TPA: ThuA domain-containing protein, partial [Puia sp.]|nr:ThuA domain-containing protein [Puia sp.]
MIAAARPFFEKMAAEDDFGLDFTDDTSRINPSNLAHYQVFVMLHLAPFDMSSAQQAALQQFVEEGKGWVGIHAAGLTGKTFLAKDSRYWQWFEDFMGGVTYSPHPAYQHATLVVEDRRHPATRRLPASMDIPDEWYEFDKSARNTVHVLASVDESTYRPNHPMGDHPIIWTNERYRRMIYIGPGHSPELLADHRYATLLRDAIQWAASTGVAGLSIPMIDHRVGWQQRFTLPLGPQQRELFRRFRQPLSSSPFTITTTDEESGTLLGTGEIPISIGDSGRYYLLRFNWVVNVGDGRYSFKATHFYEKPVGWGNTGEYSKIEYRWWDNRLGHPWSPGDHQLFTRLDSAMSALMDGLYRRVDVPRWRVLALYENGGHHIEYSRRARSWLDNLAIDSNFHIDYLTHTDSITDEWLSRYHLIIQLDYVPYGWKPGAMSAFERFIGEGRGGWIGFHHASLLGEFDGYPMWPWFHDFMGGIRWKDYIARFATAVVKVEDRDHPVLTGIPDSFIVQKEEWYTYDKSPRPRVHVLAHVEESTYQPDTTIKMGDHPVIWTNEKVPARNVYIFMGHSPQLFDDTVYKRLFTNAISWAAATPQRPAAAFASPKPRFRALAFYSTTVEPDHVDFAKDAIAYYSTLAAREHFSIDTTSNWDNCDSTLKDYRVVLWLNDFPHTDQQRTSFEKYMDQGGAWLGFHVSAYNDRDTHWPWFVRFLGGAVFYNNSWPPLPARLIVDDNHHPATHRLPASYTAPINEWYGWRPDPRSNKDVKVLITLAPANYPLGKKDILRAGDIPVVWTNTRYKMLYLNMGHGDQNFASPIQNRLFEDALLWLSAPSSPGLSHVTR